MSGPRRWLRRGVVWAWYALGVLVLANGALFGISVAPARGVSAALCTLAVGAGCISAAWGAATRSSRVPVGRERALPRGSAPALVALGLVALVARELGIVPVDFWRADTLASSRKSFFHGSLPPGRDVRLDASGPLRDGFYATCQCTPRSKGPVDAIVKRSAWYACLVPFHKPITTTIDGADLGGPAPWRLAVKRTGFGRGFAGWAACERKIGEDLGADFAEGLFGVE